MLDILLCAGDQIVEADDTVAFGQEQLAKMRADESRCS
jgi:hypothetical protein